MVASEITSPAVAGLRNREKTVSSLSVWAVRHDARPRMRSVVGPFRWWFEEFLQIGGSRIDGRQLNVRWKSRIEPVEQAGR